MAHDRQPDPAVPRDPGHGLEPGQPRTDQEPAGAGVPREGRPPRHLLGARRDVWHVEAAQPGLGVGPADGLGRLPHPLLEPAERLVSQAVIVLDDVDPSQGQAVG